MTKHIQTVAPRRREAIGLARRIVTGSVLASTMLMASGCANGIFGEIHDISLEVTGEGGQAREVYHGIGNGETLRDVRLPWKVDKNQEFVPNWSGPPRRQGRR